MGAWDFIMSPHQWDVCVQKQVLSIKVFVCVQGGGVRGDFDTKRKHNVLVLRSGRSEL